MPLLKGLPNTTGDIEPVVVRSRTHAVREIRNGNAILAADDNGSLNAWRDDDGVLRADFHRYRMTLDTQSFKTITAFAEWLREWWPRMERD